MSNEKQLNMDELAQVSGGRAASLGTIDGGTPGGGGSAAQTDESLGDGGTHTVGSQDGGGTIAQPGRELTDGGLAGA